MKRFTCLLLATICLVGLLSGCQTVEEPVPTMDDNPFLSAADLAALPVATDDMTAQQLRKLTVDYMELQSSFHWIPDMDVLDWPSSYGKVILASDLYGGIPYQSTGSGNLYRWMEYYNEETGVMALSKAFEENGGYGPDGACVNGKPANKEEELRKIYHSFKAMFNACSQSTGWAWGRSTNSTILGLSYKTNILYGFIPVGCYTYGYEHEGKYYDAFDIDVWGEVTEGNPLAYDCDDAIRDWNAQNGEDAMYKCYAQLKPGDCLVSPGHVIMVKEVHLLTDDNGQIKYDFSAITALETGTLFANQTTLGDKKYHQQGSTSTAFSFADLQKKGYLPFTFAEFLDENDPQDKKHLDYYNSYKDQLTRLNYRFTVLDYPEDCGTAAVEKGRVFANMESGDITAEQFKELVVGSNYLTSDVFVTVTDAEGKELLKNVYRNNMWTYEIPMTIECSAWKTDADDNYLPMYAGLAELAGQGNTVTVTMQISTGELLTVFTGKLI